MTNAQANTSHQRAARIAGVAYFTIIVTLILSMALGTYEFTSSGDHATIFASMLEHGTRYRAVAAYDLTMFASVVLLSVSLYVVLRPVGKNMALLALLWRTGEAILGGITVVCSLVALQIAGGEAYRTAFPLEQLQAFVGICLDVSAAALSLVLVFLCLGTIANCYLFYVSRLIPRWVSVWGIASCALMLVLGVVKIVVPGLPAAAQGVPAAAVILFEIVIGLWLMIKGVKVPSQVAQA